MPQRKDSMDKKKEKAEEEQQEKKIKSCGSETGKK
jgi:hypothetical protein